MREEEGAEITQSQFHTFISLSLFLFQRGLVKLGSKEFKVQPNASRVGKMELRASALYDLWFTASISQQGRPLRLHNTDVSETEPPPSNRHEDSRTGVELYIYKLVIATLFRLQKYTTQLRFF